MDEIELRVKSIIGEQFGISSKDIKNEDSFTADLGADSLDSVSLLVALEDALGFEISDEDAAKIRTVQNAIDYSRNILAQQ